MCTDPALAVEDITRAWMSDVLDIGQDTVWINCLFSECQQGTSTAVIDQSCGKG